MTGKTAFCEQHFYNGYSHDFHTADTLNVSSGQIHNARVHFIEGILSGD